MGLKFRSCKATYVPDAEMPLDESLSEGEFTWGPFLEDGKVLLYKPPYEGARVWSAPVTTDPEKADKAGERGTYWLWDGDERNPTLHPSLGLGEEGKGYNLWHGFLTAGHWVACE